MLVKLFVWLEANWQAVLALYILFCVVIVIPLAVRNDPNTEPEFYTCVQGGLNIAFEKDWTGLAEEVTKQILDAVEDPQCPSTP